MVIALNVFFAAIGIAIAIVPLIVAMRMMSLDERSSKELLATTVPSGAHQLGICPHCDEVLEWLVPLHSAEVTMA